VGGTGLGLTIAASLVRSMQVCVCYTVVTLLLQCVCAYACVCARLTIAASLVRSMQVCVSNIHTYTHTHTHTCAHTHIQGKIEGTTGVGNTITVTL
jgi:hypothetical protein